MDAVTICSDFGAPKNKIERVINQALQFLGFAVKMNRLLLSELNPGLLRGRQILYHLSHQGSPKLLSMVEK